MNDREEELISSGLDDELGPEERKRLVALLSPGSAHEARLQSFRHIDERLRSVGLDSIGEARLDATLESLRGRLAFVRSESATDSAGSDRAVTPDDFGRWRRWGLSSAFGAAAALTLYLILPAAETLPPTTRQTPPTPTLVTAAAPLLDRAPDAMDEIGVLEEELVLALGYGDEWSELSELNGISNEDLEVIERLDLLDFLSARDLRDRG